MDQAEAPNTPAIAPGCPRPAPIDWSAVRVLAVAVGVREAARRCGISQEAAMKRSQREGWLNDPETRAINERVTAEKRQSRMVTSAIVRSPAQVMAMELAEMGRNTRIGIAKGLERAAQVVSEMGGVQIIDNAHEIKSVTQTASVIHGWDKQSSIPRIRLDLTGSREAVTVDIESEVVTEDTLET